MANIQHTLDFGHSVNCQKCAFPIDLTLQSVRDLKACPHCGDRTWLLNLKTKEASILYGIETESLGGRLKRNANS